LQKIDEKTLSRISRKLDGTSKEILWYLWRNKHATIDELAELVAAPTHMHVLLKIKEVINPLAKSMFGSPLLVFEKSKIDYESGEKILFSWWLAERKPSWGGKTDEFPIDIFDEGDRLNIVMELRDVQEEEIQLQVGRDGGSLRIGTLDKRCTCKITLPTRVDVGSCTKRYNNGVLQVELKKHHEHKKVP
jgi:HSP20 family molecular chaperone IbpA